MKIRFVVYLLLFIYGCGNTPEFIEEKSPFENVLNMGYVGILRSDSFPLNIAEYPLNIAYFTTDTLIFDGIGFPVKDFCVNCMIDTTYTWYSINLTNFNIISSNRIKESRARDNNYFKQYIGEGMVMVSRPIFDKTMKFVLLEEVKVISSSAYNVEESKRYLVLKNEDSCWKMYKEFPIY